jgi:hypothetical protein
MMQVAIFYVAHAPASTNTHGRETDTSGRPIAAVRSRALVNRMDPNVIRINTKPPYLICMLLDHVMEKLLKVIILRCAWKKQSFVYAWKRQPVTAKVEDGTDISGMSRFAKIWHL